MLQFIVLLVLRHTLPIIISGAGEYSLTLLMVSLLLGLAPLFRPMKSHKFMFCVLQLLILRIVGILLPIYVMVRVFTSIRRRRHYQVSDPVDI